eukprot:500394_1
MSTRCYACKQIKQMNDFSKNQLKNYGNKRRCKECIKNRGKFANKNNEICSNCPSLKSLSLKSNVYFNIKTTKDANKNNEIWTISELKNKGQYEKDIWKIEALCVIKIVDLPFFCVVLMDQHQTEITLLCNGGECTVHYKDVFEKNCVYSISNGALVRFAADKHIFIRKGDSGIILHDFYEWHKVIRLNGKDKQSKIDHGIQKCKFVPIGEIKSTKERFVDVFGAITVIGVIETMECEYICNEHCTRQCNRKYRNIFVRDESGEIMVTLWDEDACNVELITCYESGWKGFLLIVSLKRCSKCTNYGLSLTGIITFQKVYPHSPCYQEMRRKCGLIIEYNLNHGIKCNECNRNDIKLQLCKQGKCTYYCNRKCQKR